ncbi:Uncharacterised protein [Vibrio cholerae]|uniref:Uncharacterized protein n=1 Tax=Vibrio cholerae TaxID=666 RepID=A0A655XEM0_VIBCL|nr:Uncharacterised protein [Vibrio cholerae]CSA45815.1 Uncharacterised protein [Vibrio cholerae]CSA59717.1 Uncharacterised protein [Vibrio cholerae]CSA65421.1 Uncharacterised protein [Vibrio cholerae]CSA73157.1 Uncharacterised protein [Vibrio cholerae]
MTRFIRQATSNDQRNTTTRTHFIVQDIGFQFESRKHFARRVITHFAFKWVNVDHIAHIELRDIHFDRQRASIFHGVKEDWSDFTAKHISARALIRHIRNIVSHKPQH